MEILAPGSYAELGGEILGPNNTSDFDEPTAADLPTGPSNLTFNNSFFAVNSEEITTCRGPAHWLSPIHSQGLDVWFPLNYGGRTYNVPYTLPFAESYHYWVPANFGTWQVDNLSAAGGPGGGWAFSWSPCS
ncbi:MAG: hypothetical protein ABSB90_09785 [Thermoplasmata archaeon]